jgi:hypothetical protein
VNPRPRPALLPVLLLLCAPLGCYWGSAAVGADGGPDGGADTGYVGDGGSTGLPCDVAAMLTSRCTSCHSSPPVGGAPMALVTYDDLTRASTVNASQTEAQRCVVRMQDTALPMPPSPASPATSAEIGVLTAWIAGGYVRGDCGAPDGGTNPYDTPPTCTSGQYIRGEEDIGIAMHPGGACNACHRQGEGPIYSIAGTVYPTAHEYNDCRGSTTSGIQVVITAAGGGNFVLGVNSSGNFVSLQSVALPYTAKVAYDGRERVMASAQQSGDCNSCHTLTGANQAPGRIMLP